MHGFTEEQILEAIKDSYGIISNIAKKLGCGWHAAKSYVEKYESCVQALKAEEETGIDNAENKMYDLINSADPQMIRYFLSTKGKRRGYTEKQEIEMTGGCNIVLNHKPVDKIEKCE